jgi:hypothetical protein
MTLDNLETRPRVPKIARSASVVRWGVEIVDPTTRYALIQNNVILGNGRVFARAGLPDGVDLIWDVTGASRH